MESKLRKLLRAALLPEPDVSNKDTSLRYTDILFGFVIKELFVRLQNWPILTSGVRWQLLVGATLVLGSWVGYRRSLNRTAYEIKFFNLPLLRFLVDQMMLILYFKIAVITTAEGVWNNSSDQLSAVTIRLIVYVFILYGVWDLLGIWMAKASNPENVPRYPEISEGKKTINRQIADWQGFWISAFALSVLVGVLLLVSRLNPHYAFLTCVVILLLYRFSKETRTSWRNLSRK